MRGFLQRLNESKGMTILISSHILDELDKIATRYGVISNGKMVDEFRADELATRCAERLVIRTSDQQKAENIIKEMLPKAQCTRAADNSIDIIGHINEAEHINKKLVESGISVSALIPAGERLEDYFLKLMGR